MSPRRRRAKGFSPGMGTAKRKPAANHATDIANGTDTADTNTNTDTKEKCQ